MMSHAPRLFAALFNHHIRVLVRTAGLALRPSASVSKASRFCPCLFALLHLSLRAIWCPGLAAHARPPLFFASLVPRFGDTRPSPSFFTLLVPYGVETSTCMIWGTLDSPKRSDRLALLRGGRGSQPQYQRQPFPSPPLPTTPTVAAPIDFLRPLLHRVHRLWRSLPRHARSFQSTFAPPGGRAGLTDRAAAVGQVGGRRLGRRPKVDDAAKGQGGDQGWERGRFWGRRPSLGVAVVVGGGGLRRGWRPQAGAAVGSN